MKKNNRWIFLTLSTGRKPEDDKELKNIFKLFQPLFSCQVGKAQFSLKVCLINSLTLKVAPK